MTELARTPKADWGATEGGVREVYYEGEPYRGNPTRVFAYYARPAEGTGPFPAMLLVHGGGGKAFPEWAAIWAKRGYVALAMDTYGHGPGGVPRADGGPDVRPDELLKLRKFEPPEVKEMWTYRAVADVVRGHSLLAALPEVDSRRIGITGISWGGYLTCIVTGIDARLRVSVPVYGCGYLHENSYWTPEFEKMPEADRRRWVESFDPSRYLAGVACPILFMNGTNDFAYPLDSYQKSYSRVPGPVALSIQPGMKHSHQAGWAPPEIYAFADSVLKGGAPLPALGPVTIEGGSAAAPVRAAAALEKASLVYTTATGPWKDREWKTESAQIGAERISAALPRAERLVFFLNVTDARGLTVSTPHQELSPGAAPR
jgi:dienelactone hydrolase